MSILKIGDKKILTITPINITIPPIRGIFPSCGLRAEGESISLILTA